MFFQTKEEKKSAAITSMLFGLLMLVLSIAIFPPEIKELEGGGGGGTIALNFGFDDQGMGDDFESTERVSSTQPNTPSISATPSEILTSDNEDAVAIDKVKELPKKVENTPKTPDRKVEAKPDNTIKPNKPEASKPKPDRNVTNAIDNLLGGGSGDGNSNRQGNQGSPNGGITGGGYDGLGGSGSGSGGGHGSGQGIGTGSGYGSGSGAGSGNGHGNYKLAGRKPLKMPQPTYKCNEEGVVVVEIFVNKSGKVVEANPGVRGSTSTAKCLTDIAKKAALETSFEPSDKAAERQRGEIRYNFKHKE
ncbi:MAG: energy transducer TonB [Bacteroidota bacterium]|nr:energy transducer TonB [Bacteroidota bacterium]